MTGKRSERSLSSHPPKAGDSNAEESGHNKLSGVVSLDFEDLSQGHPCVLIRLAGETYTLRKTQSGKLILNK